jgi:hypothetical protein
MSRVGIFDNNYDRRTHDFPRCVVLGIAMVHMYNMHWQLKIRGRDAPFSPNNEAAPVDEIKPC